MKYDYLQRRKLIADMIENIDWQKTLEKLQKANEDVWGNSTKEELLVYVVLLADKMLTSNCDETACAGIRIYFIEENLLYFDITISPAYTLPNNDE